MLTRNLAIELGPLGITINAIAPGAIATPINANLLNNTEQLKALIDQIGRWPRTSRGLYAWRVHNRPV